MSREKDFEQNRTNLIIKAILSWAILTTYSILDSENNRIYEMN